MGTGSREENTSKQESRASVPIQSERGSSRHVIFLPLYPHNSDNSGNRASVILISCYRCDRCYRCMASASNGPCRLCRLRRFWPFSAAIGGYSRPADPSPRSIGRRHGSVVIDQRIQDNAPLIGATHVRGVTENRPLPITEGNSRLLGRPRYP